MLFFLAQIQLVCFAQGTWESVVIPTQSNLNSVYFTDSITGWAVGDSGVIIHTSDGGVSWELQESNTDYGIVSLFFLNNKLGWASAFNYSSPPYGTLLLKTTNGGEDWITTNYPEDNIFITTIVYFDSLTGWMGGTPHTLIHTENGGNTWQQANIDTSTLAFFPVLNIKFYNEQYGYASGGIFDIAGVIWRTNNGGENWYAISTDDAPADEVHGLHIFDSLNVLGSGGDPDFGYGVGMMHTLNGGINWDYDELGIQGIAYDVDFVNDLEGWSPLGPRRKFIYSLDAGVKWVEISTPDSLAIFDVMFPDSLHGYAVGYDGAFLKFTPSTQVDIEEFEFYETGINMGQNYPNPFSSVTTIKIQVPLGQKLSSKARLNITDITGKKLQSIIPTNLSERNYEVVFYGDGNPVGIYFYRLIDGVFSTKAQRMTLIR